MTPLWTALLLGFLGSLHCAGMCGPIALSLPPSAGSRARFVAGRLLYNAGRVITYAVLGLAVGFAGGQLSASGWQRVLAIAAGVLLIAAAVFGRILDAKSAAVTAWVTTRPFFRALWRRWSGLGSPGALLGVGLLNGVLPCGLVYTALAGAAAAGGAPAGAAYMAVFGAGTFPMMLAIALSGRLIHGALRRRLHRAIPVMLFALGVLFILRGANLGIPYLSPKLDQPEKPCCCH